VPENRERKAAEEGFAALTASGGTQSVLLREAVTPLRQKPTTTT
jgi:hypothetical protein